MYPKSKEGLSYDFGHPDDIHGIERKVLCSNLMSEKDDDDVRGSDDGDLIPVFEKKNVPRTIHPSNQTGGGATIMKGKHQTGVKGVLNDYKRAKKMKRLEFEQKRRDKKAFLTHLATQKSDSTASTSMSANAKRLAELVLGGGNDSEEDSEEDDAFLASYRDKRISEMKNSQTRLEKNFRKTYGVVVDIFEPEKFLDVIEDAPKETFVVVHIYETFVPGCSMINRYMELVAKNRPHDLFVRMQGSLVSETFDHIACPAISVYRDGDLVKSLIRITDDIGERPEVSDFQDYIRDHLDQCK